MIPTLTRCPSELCISISMLDLYFNLASSRVALLTSSIIIALPVEQSS